MPRPRAVIFVNGDLPDPPALLPFIKMDDFIMAADGGLKHIDNLHLHPHLVIGDMDSISPDRLKALHDTTEIVRYPQQKDETDLELAVQAAIGRNFREIMIVAATGGRLDQTLANLSLLLHVPSGVSLWLEDGDEEIQVCKTKVVIRGQSGDIVSLIPWRTPVKGVSTTGLKYRLNGETLFADKTRGISNVLKNRRAVIQVTSGNLLCIHTRTTGARK